MPKKPKRKDTKREKKNVEAQSEAWVEEKQEEENPNPVQVKQSQTFQNKDNFHDHQELKKKPQTKRSKSKKQQSRSQEPKKQEKRSKSKKKKEKKILTEQQKQQKKQIQNKKKINKMLSKKSIYEIDRINRSKYQKIYLLSANREDSIWKFKVQGSTGSHYHIEIANYLQCTCHDFRIHKKPCKHIYFLVTQVAQNDHLLGKINSSTKINDHFFEQLDKQLFERLKSRMQNEKKQKEKIQIDLKDDKDCAICYCQMDKQTQDLENCQGCKKFFHLQCLRVWKSHNPTCPLCRRSFPVQPQNPLGKLQSINI